MMLAEEDASLPFELPTDTQIAAIHAEVGEPVDDIVVQTVRCSERSFGEPSDESDGFLFIQAKRRVASRTSTDFLATLDAFVHQWLARPTTVMQRTRPWDRPFDPRRDRLVLACGSDSARSAVTLFETILTRSRSDHASLKSLASSKQEREVLEDTLTRIQDAWAERREKRPDDKAVLELMRVMRVLPLALDEDGIHVTASLEHLRRTILREPTQDRAAWDCIVQHMHAIAERRMSVTLRDLRTALMRKQFALQAPPSYRGDIDTLLRLTRDELADLKRDTRFRYRGNAIHVPRDCVAILADLAREQSVLVIGQPGAGKSGALHDVAEQLHSQSETVVVLRAETLCRNEAAGSTGRVLRLNRRPAYVLEQWHPPKPGILLIDAFDAARSGFGSELLREEVADIQVRAPHWRLIVSVRIFDLRYNQHLQELFAGNPPEPAFASNDREFAHIVHFEIPTFTAKEQAKLAEQIPTVHAMAQQLANGPFGERIWLPFHLRLLAEIVDHVTDNALDNIATQTDLLDRYWKVRVDELSSDRPAYSLLIQRIALLMLEAERLNIDTPPIAKEEQDVLGDLLSAEVLTEAVAGEPERLTFGHHILADYAIARYAFAEMDGRILSQLEARPGWLIRFRPSLDMAFERLWNRPPSSVLFWQRALAVEEATGLRPIGKLVAPTVAARRAQVFEEVQPLFDRLEPAPDYEHSAALRLLKRMAQAGVALRSERPLTGATAAPWAGIADKLACKDFSFSSAVLLDFLLGNLAQEPAPTNADDYQAMARAARALFTFFQKTEDRSQPQKLPAAAGLVAHNFSADVTAAVEVLRPLLIREDVEIRGYMTLQRLAWEIEHIIPSAPAFAAEIFIAALYREERTDNIPLGSSQVLSLVTPIQNYFEGVRYSLGERFKLLFDADPVAATCVAIEAAAAKADEEERSTKQFQARISASIEAEEVLHEEEAVELENRHKATNHMESFQLDAREMRFRRDDSVHWSNHGSEWVSRWGNYISNLAAHQDRDVVLDRILDLIASKNTTAYLWRTLFQQGANEAEWLGYRLRQALAARCVLASPDLHDPVCRLLGAVFPRMASDERLAVERAILSISHELPSIWSDEGARTIRGRLLGQLPKELIQTGAARSELALWSLEGGPPPPKPLVSRFRASALPEEIFLSHALGMDVSVVAAEPNQRIRALEVPVTRFREKSLSNQTPAAEDVYAVLPHLQALWVAIDSAARDGVDPNQRAACWSTLVDAVATIARIEDLPSRHDLWAFIEGILLRAAKDPQPEEERYDLIAFDRSPSWSVAPRISAAVGLMRVAAHPELASKSILATLRELACDPVPPVRFQILWHLSDLYEVAPDLMWEIVEDRVAHEESGAVLQNLLASLSRLAGVAADRVVPALLAIRHRARTEFSHIEELQKDSAILALQFHLFREQAACDQVIAEIADAPVEHLHEAQAVLFDLRDALTLTGQGEHRARDERARRRAVALFLLLAQKLAEQWKEWVSNANRDQQVGKAIFDLAKKAAFELYFASGSHKSSSLERQRFLSHEQRRLFLSELRPAFRSLADIGEAAIAHELINALHGLVHYDPGGVLVDVANVARNARASLGQESLSHNDVVAFVRLLLANYREVITEREGYRDALLDVLDIFVERGWAEATALTFRLHEMYR